MVSTTKKIDLGYKPRELQAFLHQRMKRFNVIVCHRRFGKSYFALRHIINKAMQCPLQNPQYAYVAPTYGQAERIAWKYLKEFVEPLGELVGKNEAKLRIEIKRPHFGDTVTIYLLGSENPDSIRGMYMDGVVLDEYAQMHENLWGEVVRPLLTDRKGWACFIGTPKGMNNFFKMYQQALRLSSESPADGWFAIKIPASRSKVIDADELRQARAEMSEEEYDQEFECSFTAALVGAYYGKQMSIARNEGRIKEIPYDSSVSVDTYWDLGMSDSTVIWFIQTVGKEIRVIDYLENSGAGLDWYAGELKKKPYSYGEHWLPHDGVARELGTGVSRQETLLSFGIRTKIAPKQGLADGINAVRMILSQCWFNQFKCERGINCLENYEKKWDARNGIFSDTPLHNWASHGADGFRVFATVYNPKRRATIDTTRFLHIQEAYNPFGG
jgi:phage terminase large subunit